MKVNHIIIGAGRSGTTSLVAYLKQHVDVNFSSIKEVSYFSIDEHYNRGEAFLHSFYEEDNQPVMATSDTYLLMSKDAPERIKVYNPNIKLTIILREPASRTLSNYNFSVNHGYIDATESLIASQKKESDVLSRNDIVEQNNYCNFYGSLYHKHLSYWLQYFKREQLFICTTEQLKNNPKKLMKDYFTFLGVKDIQVKELEPLNQAATVKNKTLNSFLVNRDHWLRKVIRVPMQLKPIRNVVLKSNVVESVKDGNKQQQAYKKLTAEEQEFCHNYFREDLQKLKENFGITF